ncbi:MAG: hypothetical protein ACQESA_02800 [Patescibacteria group bacterium]
MSKLSEMSTFQLVVMIAFGAFAVGAVAMFAIGGLGGDEADSNINVTLWGTMDRRIAEEWLRGNFEDNDNVNVVYKYVNEENFDNELIDKMSLERGPDMVLISQDRLIRHRERLMKIPYDFYSENQFMSDYPQVAEVFLNKKEGYSYGFPVLIDPVVMYWNRSFVRNAGYTRPPDRWSNLKDFIQDSIKKAGNKIERSPIALGGYENIEHSKAILSTLVFQSGGGIVEGEVNNLKSVFNKEFNRSI